MAITYKSNLGGTIIPNPDGKTVTPTDDIATWLLCADIKDKTYTTINQVISDVFTLSNLIENYNAVEYMKRSSSFISDVCSNENAMTLIGANKYCADTLLSDDNWYNAICNSSHFKNVLNFFVPIMTSNTTPSGIASTDSIARDLYVAFHAFNGQDSADSDRWVGAGNTICYIQYKFDIPICVKKVEFKSCPYFRERYDTPLDGTAIIQGSNDGTTFDDLSNINITAADAKTVVTYPLYDNFDKYLYYRIQFTDFNVILNGVKWCGLNLLQFYGRA